MKVSCTPYTIDNQKLRVVCQAPPCIEGSNDVISLINTPEDLDLRLPLEKIARDIQELWTSPLVLKGLIKSMKKYTLLCLALGLFIPSLFAQKQVIQGYVLDPTSGLPLEGVWVHPRGSSVGSVTNSRGFYAVEGDVGTWIDMEYAGFEMISFQIEALSDNALEWSSPLKEIKPSQSSREFQNVYEGNRYPNSKQADISQKRMMHYAFNNVEKPRWYGHYRSRWALDKINRLPELQNDYASGRPSFGSLTYFGPEDLETFSWGPPLASLEFDGNPTDFDASGRLVGQGQGNGVPARAYDAKSFFRLGGLVENTLQLFRMGRRETFSGISLHQAWLPKIIPGSEEHRLQVGGFWQAKTRKNLDVRLQASYQKHRSDLPQKGANWTSIIGEVYRSPATFDIANGLDPKDARENESAWRLPDGRFRSYAPEVADNPYALINTMPDFQEFEALESRLSFSYRWKNVWLNHHLEGSFSKRNDRFGLVPESEGSFEGRLTERNNTRRLIKWSNRIIQWHRVSKGRMSSEYGYSLAFEDNYLDRWDGSGFPLNAGLSRAQAISNQEAFIGRVDRWVHRYYYAWEWTIPAQGFRALLRPEGYFTPSLDKASRGFGLGKSEISWDLARISKGLGRVRKFELSTSYSRGLRQAPLLYDRWGYNTQFVGVNNYSSYFEDREIFFNPNVAPERVRLWDFNIWLGLGKKDLQIDLKAGYYQQTIKDLLEVVQQFFLFSPIDNIGTLQTKGGELALAIQSDKFRSAITWSIYRPVVRDIGIEKQGLINLGGFSDVLAVARNEEVYGALVGSVYAMDNSGENQIIDDQGFPVSSFNAEVIGNPHPDWTLFLSNSLHLRAFRIQLDLEYKHGGDVWNGTQAVLNFVGRSQLTADQRNIQDFVFPGIDFDGLPNQTPVDFADPNQNVFSNRWTRYGWAGVGEENIQDASWLRIKQISIGYQLKEVLGEGSFDLQVRMFAENILLWTAYEGIDPLNRLLGYDSGLGMDLFNTPATTRFGFELDFSF